ncbi:DUF3592 domain-containing protein [Micromonospora sp. WMMD558]|uniref:DUF3592 domain-containing protein n=1 Tax=unclassified Micromonospora TaxID=2617518 RepID=UPI0012B483FC|nr:rhomboid family intramembrane serine protease [Micromonospora sp. WMMC415]QGN49732.1 hypothetical protein GKC29_24805 [Micromonospora sp. WMMC415]
MQPPRGLRWVNPLGTAYLAAFTVAGAVGALAGTTWIRADIVVLPGTLLWCGALMGAVLVSAPPPRMGLLVMAWLVSAFLMFMAATGLWSAVLAHRGEKVDATVVALRDGGEKGRHIYYTLADPGGRRIPGELGQWPGSSIGASDNPEGSVGQRVTVVQDPEGLVDPRLPEELTDSEGVWILGMVVFVVVAVLCMLAGRPEANHDARTTPSGSPRRPAERSATKTGGPAGRKRARRSKNQHR